MSNSIYNKKVSASFDVVVVVSTADLLNVNKTIKYIRRNVFGLGRIYLITKLLDKSMVLDADFIIDEDTLGVDKHLIIDWFKTNGYSTKRVNWYFQQFLKISSSMLFEKKYFVVWDGDTIPLKKIELIKEDADGVCFMIRPTSEYHIPYFFTNKKLLNLDRLMPFSFISEYAVIDTDLCKELVEDIQKDSVKPWYIKILENIPPSDVEYSGFSEYELIGNYQAKRGVRYKPYAGKSFRKASGYFGKTATDNVLDLLSKNYSFVSFENWGIANEITGRFYNNHPEIAVLIEKILEPLRETKRCFTRRFLQFSQKLHTAVQKY